jgi:hypothetical protein
MNQSKKFKYEDVFSGKLWLNDNKSSQTDPDFKGQLCTKADIDNVTTKGSDGKKNIDYSKIPSEKKLAISAWKNEGQNGMELNIKIAKKTPEDSGDFPF